MIIGWIVLALVVIFGVTAIAGFNKLRRLDIAAQEAIGGIDVQLTRRADLIPNLISTVKGYLAHEAGVLEAVTEARTGVSRAAADGDVTEKAAADATLGRAISSVLAVAEGYPDLRASANFAQLQEQLANTEGQLSFARQYYNDAAATLNTAVATIPWLLFSAMAGVRRREFYEAPEANAAPPAVDF